MGCYLVAGTAGFIGHRVSEFLLADGHTVLGIDDLNDAYDVRVKEWRLARLLTYPNFVFGKLDIANYQVLREWIISQSVKIDAVINLAARAGVTQSITDPWIYVNTNMTGNLNLLEIARHNGIKKFVLASTSSLYGMSPPIPTPETADSDHPLQPYASSKKGAESMCHSYHYLYNLDVTVLRYFTVYGPAGRPDMVMFRFAKWIMEDKPVELTGDGTQSRGFTYLDDIARGTIMALKPVGYELINLGGHEIISINDMLTILEKKIGKKAKVEYIDRHKADITASLADVSKAKRILGWNPQVSLDQGISNMVQWFIEEKDWIQQVELP